MTTARAERAEISDLFERLGPDAPTLCEGWATADLAAHLVLRERRLDAMAGIALAPLAGYTASVQQKLKTSRSWPDLIGLVRNGPPRWSPYGLIPGLDAAANGLEFFIHHEDVRRAQPGWEPRELTAGFEDQIWQRLRRGARLMLRKAPVGVLLRRTDGQTTGGKKGEPHVTVTGDPAELLLFAFGRQTHARISYDGDDASVARLSTAPLGL